MTFSIVSFVARGSLFATWIWELLLSLLFKFSSVFQKYVSAHNYKRSYTQFSFLSCQDSFLVISCWWKCWDFPL